MTQNLMNKSLNMGCGFVISHSVGAYVFVCACKCLRMCYCLRENMEVWMCFSMCHWWAHAQVPQLQCNFSFEPKGTTCKMYNEAWSWIIQWTLVTLRASFMSNVKDNSGVQTLGSCFCSFGSIYRSISYGNTMLNKATDPSQVTAAVLSNGAHHIFSSQG